MVTTLGTERDAQLIDAIEGERKEPFMLHYNFPPYSVGEAGFKDERKVQNHGMIIPPLISSVRICLQGLIGIQ